MYSRGNNNDNNNNNNNNNNNTNNNTNNNNLYTGSHAVTSRRVIFSETLNTEIKLLLLLN